MSDSQHTFEIVFWKGASVLCKQQGPLICRSLLHKEFHKSAESFMSRFSQIFEIFGKSFQMLGENGCDQRLFHKLQKK